MVLIQIPLTNGLNEFVTRYAKQNKMSKQRAVLHMIKEFKLAEEELEEVGYNG